VDPMKKLVTRLICTTRTTDPFAMAEALGIHIRYMDLGKSTKGLYYRKLRRRFIVINEQLPEEWRNFVCAHELGHDRLHKGVNRFFIEEHSFFSAGKLERQANRFAMLLLTSGTEPIPGESFEHFLLRSGIPADCVYFFAH